MSNEARIRVRLETSGADQDRRRMERGFEQSTKKAGRMAGTMGLSMKSVFAGTLAAQGTSKLLATLANTATARSVKETLVDEVILGSMGNQAGTALGSLNSRDAVVSRFGKAAGMGLVSPEMIQRAFEHEQRFGAGAEARGAAQIRGLLGESVRDAGLDALVERLGQIIGKSIKESLVSTAASAIGFPR